MYVESFREVFDAIEREKQIKRWSRRKKEALIRGQEDKLFIFAWSGYRRKIEEECIMVRRAHHDTLLTPSREHSVSP